MTKELKEINNKIIELQEEKKKIKVENKKEKRLRANGIEEPNIHMRVSRNFQNKLDDINEQRNENGLERISNPKATDLIIKHLTSWPLIEEALLFFDTNIMEEKINVQPIQ